MVPGINEAMSLSERLTETSELCVFWELWVWSMGGYFCCAFCLKSGLEPAPMTVLYEQQQPRLCGDLGPGPSLALVPCFSAHPRPHQHTGHGPSGGHLPLPKRSGFPMSPPASPGSGSCGSVPTAHFPLGSPGNHQKATAPDASPALPSDERCVRY